MITSNAGMSPSDKFQTDQTELRFLSHIGQMCLCSTIEPLSLWYGLWSLQNWRCINCYRFAGILLYKCKCWILCTNLDLCYIRRAFECRTCGCCIKEVFRCTFEGPILIVVVAWPGIMLCHQFVWIGECFDQPLSLQVLGSMNCSCNAWQACFLLYTCLGRFVAL